MKIDTNLQMLAGPVALPNEVTAAMTKKIVHHRTDEYKKIQQQISENIKKIFKTNNDIIIQSSSGTGALEAVVQNCFEKDDEIIVAVNGSFGELFYDVAKPYLTNIKLIESDWHHSFDNESILSQVTENTAGVLICHNESTTGVVNDIESLGRELKNTNTLLIVDSISGAGNVNVEMDNWNIDILISASQKCLMAPPGIAFIALSDLAWEKVEQTKNPKYYFNFLRDREYLKRNLTVHTPAIQTIQAVNASLKMITEAGIDNVISYHEATAKKLRHGLTELGLSTYCKDSEWHSSSLTCVEVPENAALFKKELEKRGIEISGGKRPLDKDTVRIGTMGYVSEQEVDLCLMAIKDIIENGKKIGKEDK